MLCLWIREQLLALIFIAVATPGLACPCVRCVGSRSTMKGSAASLAALLLLALCSSAVAQLLDSDGLPTTCCLSYVQRPVPRSLIASAYITSSKCRLPAVILVTKKGKEICANPEESWVQKRLELLQNQEN